MLLWNWLVPQLFSGPVLGYWQTLGILILSKILFTGLSQHHRDGPPSKSRNWGHDHGSSYWRRRYEEKMNGKAAAEESPA
jgi:hypothetical protein